MTRKICDACKTEVAPDSYGLPPIGWLSVRVQGLYTENTDCCSVACAVAHLPTLPQPAIKKAA